MIVRKVLNIEDTMTKHVAVLRALNRCGVPKVDHATTAMEGLAMIEAAIEEGKLFDINWHIIYEKCRQYKPPAQNYNI